MPRVTGHKDAHNNACKGISLYTKLHIKREKLSHTNQLYLLRQIANAITYLHSRNNPIVVRRLSSKNIFLKPKMNLYLTDYSMVDCDYQVCSSDSRLSELFGLPLRDERTKFRKDRSCTCQIATLRIIIEQPNNWNYSPYINLLDCEKAFDSVDRRTLWNIIQRT
ncbi:unnamed protein product [Schistosoma curassoni]|uniref:Protein kinase domain-containing protein n=1 Tax=Schistosoma curassoni TaxID=6186 RepID=A0A183JID4_9TREM|nr:unnamed protein product [Schistosoma curassoni]